MFIEYMNNPKTKSTRAELQVCKAHMMACCRQGNRHMHNIIGVCNVQLHVPDARHSANLNNKTNSHYTVEFTTTDNLL